MLEIFNARDDKKTEPPDFCREQGQILNRNQNTYFLLRYIVTIKGFKIRRRACYDSLETL